MNLCLLADAASQLPNTEGIPIWGQILGGVSSFGFAVWCAYYTTKHAIPRLQKQCSEAIERQQVRHEESTRELVVGHQKQIGDLVGQFRAELKEQRDEFKAATTASIEAVNEVAKAVERLTQHVNTIGHPMKPISTRETSKK